MTAIPWHDHTTLIRTTAASIHEGGRTIVAEGPLHRMLDIADALVPAELDRHFIALPDRGAAPFRYNAEAIRALLGRLDRPGALALVARCAGAR